MRENNINKLVEYKLKEIDSSLKQEVSVRDLVYLYRTIEIMNNYFHNPDHYETVDKLQDFLGNVDSGGYSVIHKCYYKIFDGMLPKEIEEELIEGDLDWPENPCYFSW